LVVTDAVGNETTVNFTIDTTPPTVSGVTEGEVYQKATPVFTEGTAKLNTVAFTSGTEIVTEGAYTLVVTDAAGNETTVNFAIDMTPPTITGVSEGGVYKSATPVFTEGTAKLNTVAFTSGTEIVTEGAYTLVVTDAAGNEATVNFTIDTTPPTITGVSEGGVYKSATPVFTEGTAKLNTVAFTSGTEIVTEGAYTLVVTDAVGNEATVNFAIDMTPPTITGVSEGGVYKSATPVFTEGTAKLNTVAFTSGTVIGTEGPYTLVVTDAAGNEATVNFTIDTTPPTVSRVTEGEVYQKATPVFTEGTAKLNTIAFTSGTEIVTEGAYTLVVTDAAGNETTIRFTIDTTPPTVTGVSEDGVYKSATPVFTEGTAKLNTVAFTSGTVIGTEGAYTLVVTDAVGNETTVNFTIDTTPPTVTGVSEGGVYKSATPVFTEGTAKLNTIAFTSGTEIVTEGAYSLVVTDAVGNETTVNFTIDTTPPTVSGVTEGEVYQKATPVFTEGTAKLNTIAFTSGTEIVTEGAYTLVVTDAVGNEATIRFTIDTTPSTVSGVTEGEVYQKATPVFIEGTAKLNTVAFTSGTEIVTEGAYTLVVTDAVGNEATIRFTIDTTPPTVTGVSEGGVYKSATPVFTEGTAKLNTIAFTSGTEIVTEGAYTLVVTDAVGNETTVNFTIDTTPPTVSGVTEGEVYQKATPVFTEGTAKLNT
ncbi:hypothetical protein D3P07_26620, partial [Paenibacillus sp. 1011MAR3C5]